ncbi:hypothetical protein HYQ46_005955 [Verticillium longisporum]|uniref:Uncharacterized protein n=2 Tax=Verticillium dahliae TaxID=27337 RepID=G2XFK0_VERDV|nr:uncharacterized protein VDAG_09124 [Verticillium dahliae VdLs.17]EGY18598.1 hypothetical protein VDAG_09124 [Verticillium dahliae VdLs.17]KAG7102258.1 hypothetical protein HYQ44_018068 [Verticillium longisporum]KAG7145327.1 hypothetical protein HYQ46_005955 [Verticillium longisporum]KAH6705835.1 hypothetical protein EV126DRAFT_490520 [Verticillium dahliae]
MTQDQAACAPAGQHPMAVAPQASGSEKDAPIQNTGVADTEMTMPRYPDQTSPSYPRHQNHYQTMSTKYTSPAHRGRYTFELRKPLVQELGDYKHKKSLMLLKPGTKAILKDFEWTLSMTPTRLGHT